MMKNWMDKASGLLLSGVMLILSGCATTGVQEPQIKRISQEELERLMPKPTPNLTLDEIVKLSKANTPPEEIIAKIKVSNSTYELTPSQVVDLNKQGVSPKVLDHIQQAREQVMRDAYADEINKREKAKVEQERRMRREYQMRSYPYYDPWWGYSYGPYYGYRPFYGPGFGTRFHYGWGW
jgi:hypothetical protein